MFNLLDQLRRFGFREITLSFPFLCRSDTSIWTNVASTDANCVSQMLRTDTFIVRVSIACLSTNNLQTLADSTTNTFRRCDINPCRIRRHEAQHADHAFAIKVGIGTNRLSRRGKGIIFAHREFRNPINAARDFLKTPRLNPAIKLANRDATAFRFRIRHQAEVTFSYGKDLIKRFHVNSIAFLPYYRQTVPLSCLGDSLARLASTRQIISKTPPIRGGVFSAPLIIDAYDSAVI